MVRLYMLVLLLMLLTQAFPQSSPPRNTNRATNYNQPISNQFEHLSVKEGLSNNSVNCIIQDREGFMWFGTAEGLNKYDGYTFTVFQPNSKDSTHSFKSSHISFLHEDRLNRLWVATEGGGLHEVNKQTGLVTPYAIEINGSRENQWNNQLTIYEDSQGILWITSFAGLLRFDPTSKQFKRYPTLEPDVPFKTVFEDRQHRFWVATNRGLYLFNRSTGEFTLVPVQVTNSPQPAFMSFYLDDKDVLWMGTATAGYSLFRLDLRRQPWHLEPYNPGGQLHQYTFLNSLHRDKAGMIWVGTTSGLQSIDPAGNRVFTYNSTPTGTKGISSNNAQAVYHDRSGMLWVGTDNGIDRQAVNIKPFETYQVTPNKGSAHLLENRVNALLKDSYGQVWLTNLGNVYRSKPNKAVFEVVAPEELGSAGTHKNLIYSFLSDNSAGIWLGTPDGLYHFDQATGKYTLYPSEIPAQFISRAPTGNLWVGGEGGIASFNVRTHKYNYYKAESRRIDLPDRYVQTLLVSRTGDVWVLIRRHGISRLNPATGRFTRYTAGSKGISSNDVLSIYEDSNGLIWIGTHLGGLNRFDPRTGIFTVITSQDGIPGNNVASITGDNAGYLWLSTDKGLCQFDPKTKTVHNYEIKNGLPSNDFQDNAVFQHRNELFFGSLNGAVHFNPSRFRNDNRQFPVRITSLSVMNQPRPLTDSVVTLEHNENLLTFEFSALDYVLPEQNRYKYQLIGVDKDWVQSGNRHFANYTNLSPGSYTFRVKAANSDGVWSSQKASLQVIIQPPLWATWWAYCLYALSFLGAIWLYIRFYTNQIRQKQESELIRREAEQMKAIDEVKNRFFANITHEFRTPLTLILSPVGEMLQTSRFDRQSLLSVRNNANKILLLINQILDISKLEAHQMPVSLVQGDIDEFINHIIELFRRAAEQKSVSLTYKAENLPAQNRLFDSDKWEKILMNLLANALKFTDTGGQITVTITPVSKDDEIVSVQLAVADSGIGISPEKLPHIFDRFYQADTSTTRAYEGTGIGLSLTKELVDVLGGTITVDSKPGVGTTFLVILPVSPVPDKAVYPSVILSDVEADIADQLPVLEAAQTDETGASEDSQVPQILVVEDNDELRTLLVRGLSTTYHVLQANNGQTGWELAQSELPDIVISDVMMPRMDGFELTRHIKTHSETDHIAVVLLTAKAAQSSRVEGLELGADDYLTKPFDLKELRLRLHNLLTRQQKLQEQYRQQLSLPDTPAPLTVVDDPFLLQIYELLERNLDNTDINVNWLADHLSINRKMLLRKVNSLLQLTPTELIRQYRLRKAADLLREDHSVSETADLVGFKTPSHFTNAFREFYGKTPTQFVNNK